MHELHQKVANEEDFGFFVFAVGQEAVVLHTRSRTITYRK